ncbi:hypothetical protein SDC9_146506 [bioreactor metagenome]|uniref:Uncharacterized protein n=1 Tax=bioreactor metagenome TaxID=1076179 RepID=A0A645ECU8_9ZZZZ
MPPIECSGGIDVQSLSKFPDGGPHTHEPDVLQPNFLGEMAAYPYRPFGITKSLAAIDTNVPLVP